MSYRLTGHFIESCDCTVICPCWVDDDPVGGHCTGFIAWQIDEGAKILVDGTPVGGCTVVSVATHAGNRRDSNNTTTMLFIGVPEPTSGGTDGGGGATSDPDAQFRILVELFSGRRGGPLAELSQVSGTVVGARRARIEISDDPENPAKDSWRVTVRPETPHLGAMSIDATGHPKVFDTAHGNTKPLTLAHTAISYELSAPGPVEAQTAQRLKVSVGALPGGNIEVTGRSGMRGTFSYDHPDRGRLDPPERAEVHE